MTSCSDFSNKPMFAYKRRLQRDAERIQCYHREEGCFLCFPFSKARYVCLDSQHKEPRSKSNPFVRVACLCRILYVGPCYNVGMWRESCSMRDNGGLSAKCKHQSLREQAVLQPMRQYLCSRHGLQFLWRRECLPLSQRYLQAYGSDRPGIQGV